MRIVTLLLLGLLLTSVYGLKNKDISSNSGEENEDSGEEDEGESNEEGEEESGEGNNGQGVNGVFDVKKFGAKGDGKPNINEDGESDNSMAFIRAWRGACDSTEGATKVVIPKGNFLIGPVIFHGPCKSTVTVDIKGVMLADPDVSLYSEPYFIMFEDVEGVTVKGTGTIDGQGAVNWKLNDCKVNPNCAPLPTSIKLQGVKNAVIKGIESLNPMFNHIFVQDSHNVTVKNMKITAAANSPSTIGVHMERSDLVKITNTVIATGEDCVAIGHGCKNIRVSGLTCGPGSGISVGPLGESDGEVDVSDIVVKNTTFIKTTNGARITSMLGLRPNKASGITFEDLVMDHVQNPIIIDQQIGPLGLQPSHVKLSKIQFKNISGTSATKPLVKLACSPLLPCDGIEVADINLTYDAKSLVATKNPANNALATCLNAKVVFDGKHDGLLC